MILDTNALSAWAEGNAACRPAFAEAQRLLVPTIVLGGWGASPFGAEINFWRAFARVGNMRAKCPTVLWSLAASPRWVTMRAGCSLHFAFTKARSSPHPRAFHNSSFIIPTSP